MSITGVRDVDEVPAEVNQGSDLPPNMSMSTVIHTFNCSLCYDYYYYLYSYQSYNSNNIQTRKQN